MQQIEKPDMDAELRATFSDIGNMIRRKFVVDEPLKIEDMADAIDMDNVRWIPKYVGYTLDENGNLTRGSRYDDIVIDAGAIGERGLQYVFYQCTNIKSARFDNLSSIGDYGMKYCFYSCSKLTAISFPSLSSIGSYGMYQCFQSCSNLKEIHFKASSRSVVEATYGYSSKFGATNATIYFDL